MADVSGSVRGVGPPQIPVADLVLLAQGLADGRRQAQLAAEFGWSPSRVTRCLVNMRNALAAGGDGAWLDTRQRTPAQVAQEWLKQRSAEANKPRVGPT